MASGPALLTITLADPQFLEKLVVENTPLSSGFEEGNYVETIAGVEVPLGPGFVTSPRPPWPTATSCWPPAPGTLTNSCR